MGLIQDLANQLEEQVVNYLDRKMNLLYKILDDQNMSTDIKTIGIMAIGDICLAAETDFRPHFERSMNILISAG